MGFLSSVVNTVKTLVTKPVESFKQGAMAVSALTAAPMTTIKSGLQAGQQQVKQQGVLTSSLKSVGTLGTVAALTVGGGAALGSQTAKQIVTKSLPVATKLVSKFTPTTPKGIIATTVAAPIVIGAIASQPAKTANILVSAPSELAKFGGDVANFAASPSIETGKQIITESPLISAGVGLLAAGTAIKALAPPISNLLTREQIKQTGQEIKGAILDTQEIGGATGTPTTLQNITPSNPLTQPLPVTAQTKTVEAGITSKSRRKTRKKAPQSNNIMNQRVNILVSAANKKYINRFALNKAWQ